MPVPAQRKHDALTEGIRAARQTYPERLGDAPAPARDAWSSEEPSAVVNASRPGVVTSFDRDALGLEVETPEEVADAVRAYRVQILEEALRRKR